MRERPPKPRLRLAIVVTHPIQYFVPLYRALAATHTVELKVLFCTRIGVERYHDPGMGVELAWSMDMLGGYASTFLVGADRVKKLSWRGVDNKDVGAVLEAFAPDAVIINGYAHKTLLRALWWCKRHGVPAMMLSDSTVDASPGAVRRALKRVVVPRLLARFGALLTMSERSETYFTRLGVPATRVFRVPTMVDESFWRAQGARASLRHSTRARLGLTDDEVVVACVGKLQRFKRVDDIIAALGRLRALPLRLLVLGDGAERGELEAAARAAGVRSTFTGFVNLDALPAYYAAADILVHASELEQFGMIAVEAAILGLPLVLSDRVGAIGASSVARPGENTLVFACGDVGALTAAIERLAVDGELRTKMGRASLAIAAEHRGARSVASVLAAAQSCLRRAGRPLGFARMGR